MFIFITLAPSRIPATEESLCLFQLWELEGTETSGKLQPKGGTYWKGVDPLYGL